MANFSAKHNISTNHQRGYIALISAIVISILLLAITTTLSFSGFYSRFNVLDFESKKISSQLARACINSAILKIISNPNYTGAEDIVLDVTSNKKCKIVSAASSGNQKIIQTQAVYNSAYTNFKTTIDSNFNIVSLNECAVSPCP